MVKRFAIQGEVDGEGEGDLTLRVAQRDLPHLRETVRQQLLGDRELIRDCLAGRENPDTRIMVRGRILFLRNVADQFGMPEARERRRAVRRPLGPLPRRPAGWRRWLADWLLK